MSPQSIRPVFVEIGWPRVTYCELCELSDAEGGLKTSDSYLNRHFNPSHVWEPLRSNFPKLRLTIYQSLKRPQEGPGPWTCIRSWKTEGYWVVKIVRVKLTIKGGTHKELSPAYPHRITMSAFALLGGLPLSIVGQEIILYLDGTWEPDKWAMNWSENTLNPNLNIGFLETSYTCKPRQRWTLRHTTQDKQTKL